VAKVERSGMELSPPEDNTISELGRTPFPSHPPLHLAHSTLLENESSALEELSCSIRLRIAQILAGKTKNHLNKKK